MPAAANRKLKEAGDDLRAPKLLAFAVEVAGHGGFVSHHQVLQDVGGGDAGQVRATGGGGERQAQANEVMRGVADDGLVEVADLDRHAPLAVGEGAEVAEVAIAADPHRRPVRQVGGPRLQPFVELDRAAAHIGVGRPRHLEVPRLPQTVGALFGFGHR